MTQWRNTLGAGLRIFLDRRLILIFMMGISSGLPILLTLSTLSYAMRQIGVDLTTIGLFAAAGLPYSLKFLWAPIIDKVPLPFLTRRFGQRRGWALLTQVLLIFAISSLGLTNPLEDPLHTAAAVVAIAFFSASQDIVIDAVRIELLKDEEMGPGSAMTQAGYRIGLLIAGAGAIALSDYFDWDIVFMAVAACMPIGMIAVLLAQEPQQETRKTTGSFFAFVQDGVIAPFVDFLKQPAPWAILLFVLLYKFGDAIGGVMANPFYFDMGFTGAQIAFISKTLGLIATMIGIFAGGFMVKVVGLVPTLVVGGILQAVTNLLFAWLAVSGTDPYVFAIAILGDNFTGGLGSAAFIAYLSILCNRDFSVTQYALLSSFMSFGRTLMSTPSGYLAEQMGWAPFFIATAFLAIPGLLLIAYLSRYGYGLPKKTDQDG